MGTKTSSFGTSKREGHDASQFYSSQLYQGLEIDENKPVIDASTSIPESLFNTQDALNFEVLGDIEKNSIHLAIMEIHQLTEEDYNDFSLYLSRREKIFQQIYDCLITGGRLVVIVDNVTTTEISHTEFFPLHYYLIKQAIKDGFLMRGEIIWNYISKAGLSLENDEIIVPKSVYKHALIFSKEIFKRIKKDKESGQEKSDTITRDQFLAYTKSVWKPDMELLNFSEEEISNLDKIKIDLYTRLLQLYSFQEDTILYLFPRNNDQIQPIANLARSRNIFISLD
jgi:site-specific DNA-methyltransferase (adenine-specific)